MDMVKSYGQLMTDGVFIYSLLFLARCVVFSVDKCISVQSSDDLSFTISHNIVQFPCENMSKVCDLWLT